jgi:serine/threonine protein phosphatase PrpC
MLRPNELNEVIQSRFIGPLEDLAERLVERALEEGGYDNVSLIVGRVEPADGVTAG